MKMSDLHLEGASCKPLLALHVVVIDSCLVQKVLTPNNSLDHLQCRCISLDQEPSVHSVIWITATCVTQGALLGVNAFQFRPSLHGFRIVQGLLLIAAWTLGGYNSALWVLALIVRLQVQALNTARCWFKLGILSLTR